MHGYVVGKKSSEFVLRPTKTKVTPGGQKQRKFQVWQLAAFRQSGSLPANYLELRSPNYLFTCALIYYPSLLVSYPRRHRYEWHVLLRALLGRSRNYVTELPGALPSFLLYLLFTVFKFLSTKPLKAYASREPTIRLRWIHSFSLSPQATFRLRFMWGPAGYSGVEGRTRWRS
jgi:hypothetical protein